MRERQPGRVLRIFSLLVGIMAALHFIDGVSESRANELPEVRRLAAGAFANARQWQPDAELTMVHVGFGHVDFTLVSLSAKRVLSLSDTGLGGPVSELTDNTVLAPLPHGFIDLAEALRVAHSNGMVGDMDHASLMVYQSPGGKPLAAWLIAPQDDDQFRTWLIGALDGKVYPTAQYFEPLNGNDRQLAQLAAKMAPPAAPAPATPGCTVNRSFNFFDPCSRRGGLGATAARLDALHNRELWMAGKPAYY